MGNDDDEVVWYHPVAVAGVDGGVAVAAAVVEEEADVNVDGEGDVAARGVVVELTGDGDGSIIGGNCCCCCCCWWYSSSNSACARSAIEKTTEPVVLGGDFVRRLLGLGTISIDDKAVSDAVVDPPVPEAPSSVPVAGGGFVPTRSCCTDSSFSTGQVVVAAVDILNPEILLPTIVTGEDGGILVP